MNKDIKIVFMGTPDFAVPSLDILIKKGYNVVAVVTAPDKPAGRGRKINFSPVKKYALVEQIPVLQPTNLKDIEFIKILESYKANLQVVVAFRMLPESIWKMPSLGTFNLHASLLPQYRGAAPINWAVINGEKETGITTFFIDEKIDTGLIILNEKLRIGDSETAGELHDRLMLTGSGLVLKTVKLIQENKVDLKPQNELLSSIQKLNPAPKIFKEDTRINWEKPGEEVFNLIRGLSPYPGAFTELIEPATSSWSLKIFNAELMDSPERFDEKQIIPGDVLTDNKTYLCFGCNDGFICVNELQLEGKRRMKTTEFLRGFTISQDWRVGKK